MPGLHSRLQLATKIHFFLLRELGQGIDVEQMLKGATYARDVLLVCEACRGTELAALARQFRAASAMHPAAPGPSNTAESPGHARQPLDWGSDTSGFGASDLPAEPAEIKRSWFARLTTRR